MAHKLTTCTFCGVGCGIYLETREGEITGAYPSMSHPANQGRLCVRGWNVHEVASAPDRLQKPLIKRKGNFEEVSWDEAFDYVAERLKALVTAHGPDSVGFLNSPRCSNEETFLLQKLARTLIGTNNVDHGTGVHRNNSIEVLREMLGLPAATASIADIAKADVLVVDGVDVGRQLPTIGGWLIRAKLNGAKLIVVDPRRHRLAEHADYFLQIRPGTDELIYGAFAKVIFDRGLCAREFIKKYCEGFEEFQEKVRNFDLLWVAENCGVDPGLLEGAALAYAEAQAALTLYSTGVEARGLSSIQALVNLALLSGNLGKPGAGIIPLAEQNNLQGVCDMGMLPNFFPGYVPVEDEAGRARLEQLWQTKLPAAPGAGARTMLANAVGGQLKALWLGRHDPAVSATFCDARSTLEQLDFVVAQHLFMTESAQLADVVLPVTAFGEEKVTFTSTERRIQLAEQAKTPTDGPMPAWRQVVEVARRLGAEWEYTNSAQVMEEICTVIPFYEAADYANLSLDYGRQWPCTKVQPLGTERLYEAGPGARRFKFEPMARPSLVPCATDEYPYAVILGHSLYYWNQNVLIQHSETLKREYSILLLDYPDGFVELNDEDARELNVRDGQQVKLISADGEAIATARVTHEVKSKMIFIPFFLREVVEQLLGSAPCEEGAMPRPVCVRVEKV